MNSSEIYWQENGKRNIISYVVKTSKGKKNIIVLSTLEPILGVTSDDGKSKPAIIKLYDFSKGGTDIVDQKMGFYTTKTKSRRWTIVCLAYLLDTIRVNSTTVYALNNGTNPKKQNSFNFGFELAKCLIMPHINRRSRNGLTSIVLRKIMLFAGQDIKTIEDINNPQTVARPTRCRACLQSIQGENQKLKKDKLKKVRTTCQKCGDVFCKEHLIQTCLSCSNM